MKAAFFDGPQGIRIADVPDARIVDPADAVVRVVLSAVCGTGLHGYHGHPVRPGPGAGHEFLGVVDTVGPRVRFVRPGQLVVAPFIWCDGECDPCRAGLPTSCHRGGMWGGEQPGAQAEAVRVPFADATLVRLPIDEADERLPTGFLDTSLIFDHTTNLDAVAASYRAMADRTAVKALLRV